MHRAVAKHVAQNRGSSPFPTPTIPSPEWVCDSPSPRLLRPYMGVPLLTAGNKTSCAQQASLATAVTARTRTPTSTPHCGPATRAQGLQQARGAPMDEVRRE